MNRTRNTVTDFKRPERRTTPFNEFQTYENGRVRSLKYDVNALADFEQETGMGFALMMNQRASFGATRAMLWAGLKHEDRALTIEDVGELLSDYLMDADVKEGEHTIDTILGVALRAAATQGALGRKAQSSAEEAIKKEEEEVTSGPNVVEGQAVLPEPSTLV